MKRKCWLLAIFSLILSGCGDVDWFPDNRPLNDGGQNLASPTLKAAVDPAVLLDGGASTITFTISNQTGNPAQSELGFVQQLPAGLTASVDNSSQCGGDVSVPSTSQGTKIVFMSGQLAAGSASCTITATLKGALTGATEQNPAIQSSDFSQFQSSLVSGVETLHLLVVPTAVTGGAVTVSNLTPAGSDTTEGKIGFTFDADTFNNTGSQSDVNATVTVVGLDAKGAEIPSTSTSIAVTIPPSPLLQEQVAIGTGPKEVTVADADKIVVWRIKSVSVQ